MQPAISYVSLEYVSVCHGRYNMKGQKNLGLKYFSNCKEISLKI